MNPSATAPPDTAPPTSPDQIEQARPGHGIPSQDQNPAAQYPREPGDAEREATTLLIAGGAAAGGATGAVTGVMVAGPVGMVIGATLGAVAGALGGSAAGGTPDPEDATRSDATPQKRVRRPTDDGDIPAGEVGSER